VRVCMCVLLCEVRSCDDCRARMSIAGKAFGWKMKNVNLNAP